MEEFRYIKGFGEKYAVSNKGRVFSFKRLKSREMKAEAPTNIYKKVSLSKDGKKKSYLIHHLVARHFLEKEPDKPHINHIDGNKKNNNVENLEFCTSSENAFHAYKSGLRIANKGVSKKSAGRKVGQYNKEGELLNTYETLRAAEKAIGARPGSSISKVAKKGRGHVGGFQWKFI